MITYPNVKVNLGLSVLRRRPDGYHDLETLFVPFFGFHDTLEIITGNDFSRTSAGLFSRYTAGSGCCPAGSRPAADPSHLTMGPSLFRAEGGTSLQGSTGVLPTLEIVMGSAPSIAQTISEDGKVMITIARAEGVDWDPAKDLTVKAYKLLDADFNLPTVKIFLEKTSPVGAGLGGGSADAAFALKMLNELFSLGLDDAALASYAARLGSDCAFFIYNRPMMGTGRGEILEPYALEGMDFSGKGEDPDAAYDLRVEVPEGICVSTADAYRGITPREAWTSQIEGMPQKAGTSQIAGALQKETMSLREALSKPVAKWRDVLVNDFEANVFAKYPELSGLKRKIYDNGAAYAAMSGSGSALFGIFPR